MTDYILFAFLKNFYEVVRYSVPELAKYKYYFVLITVRTTVQYIIQ